MTQWKVVDDAFRKHKKETIKLPMRKTASSAGYDMYTPKDITVPAYGSSPLFFTDVKAEFQDDQVLLIVPRSSLGRKGITLANTIGVIDADYADNPSTGGNIGVQLVNSSNQDLLIKAGESFGQAILINYGTFENGNTDAERTGGFGSTGRA